MDKSEYKTPFKDLLPPLAKAEQEALKADLIGRGQLNDILVDEEKNVLDGHHRLELLENPRIKVIRGLKTVEEKQAFVMARNFQRRNLSPDQKKAATKTMKAIAKKLRQSDPKKWTQENLAKAFGVAQQTVSDWEASWRPKGKDTTNTGTGGGCDLPSAKTIIPKSEHAIILARLDAGESQEQVAADYGVSQQAISKIAKKAAKVRKAQGDAAEESRKAAEAETSEGRQLVVLGRFQDAGNIVADESVDLIFTDPPYDRATLPQYADLAAFGARVLIPGGSLICYLGHYAMPEILALMTPHLSFHWCACIIHTGGNRSLPGKNVMVGWKPLLWFTKGTRWNTTQVRDCLRSEIGEKDKYHEWAQGAAEASYYIEHLTRDCGLVVDPYCGGGTTGEATLRLGRRFLSFEIAEKTALKARGRLHKIMEESVAKSQ